MKLSLDRDQGYELLQRQEWNHVIPWVLHSDGADLSCMVPKMKGASRHMHLISEKNLIEGLSGCSALLPWLKGILGCEGAQRVAVGEEALAVGSEVMGDGP
ncbi:hypothetical protein B296_00034134 [Ensete ventricosum]|uniref:Uncharacterized protein n=1 Tax=Ensete ventricosum TaxID=4639 RepID=A0A427A991_ENSVE|nr:hypothetical protein B296_00034134 [Ensete ventricosum]